MTPLATFVMSIVGAGAAGGAIVAILHRPLGRMLADSCATEARSRFWASYLETLFVLAPIVSVAALAALGMGLQEFDRFLVWAALFASGGVLAALLIAGGRIATVLGGINPRQPVPTAFQAGVQPAPNA